METSLKTGFAQIFSRCPKNLSCPKFGGAAAPLASPARTPMIVANKPYTDQLYFQELTLFLFTSVYFDITESSEVQLIKNTLKKRNLRTKQWNPLSFRLFPLASMISRSFQTVRRMREAWWGETYVRSQSFSSESAVKYLHVGRRKIQKSPPLGEQD